MGDEPSSFKGLPKWPTEAKEPAAEEQPRRQHRLIYILGGSGLVLGFLQGMASGQGDIFFALGGAVALGLLFAIVGTVLGRRRRAQDHRRDRD